MKLSRNAKLRLKATASQAEKKKIAAAATLLAEFDLITLKRCIVIKRAVMKHNL